MGCLLFFFLNLICAHGESDWRSRSNQHPVGSVSLPSSGLLIWFKANAGVTKDDQGRVSSWVDQTSNYPVTQTDQKRPTFVERVLNDRPVLRFDGTQWLFSQTQVSDKLNGGLTMISVHTTKSPDEQRYSIYLGGSGSVGASRAIGYSGSWQGSDYYFKCASGTRAPDPDTFVIEGTTLDNSCRNVEFYRNGLPTGVGRVGKVKDIETGLSVGTAHNAATYAWKGDIAELLVYDHRLSAEEMEQVARYLGDKYGLYAPGVTWIKAYLPNVQTLIDFHQWSKAQADAYVALQNLNPKVPMDGLCIWFKADLGVSHDMVDKVSSWEDQTGAYTVAQTGEARPAYVPDALNDQPVLRFNGSQWLFSPVQVTDKLNGAETFITVASTTDPGGQRYNVFLGGGGSNSGGRGMGYKDSRQTFDYYFNFTSGAGAPKDPRYVIEAVTLDSSRGQVKFYRDGVCTATSGAGGLANIDDGLSIGTANNTSCVGWKGDIAEILVYDHALTPSDLLQVEQYLALKYGLCLPHTDSDHSKD